MLGRTWRWISEQIAFLAVLAVLASAFLYLLIEPGRWSRATGIVAGSVLLGGALRLLLPTERVGMLAIRGRALDVACFLVLGSVTLAVDIRLHG